MNKLFFIMGKLCILFGLSIIVALPLKAQWKAICTKLELKDTVFDVRSSEPAAFRDTFYFPEYSYIRNLRAVEGGMECPVLQGAIAFRALFHQPEKQSGDPVMVVSRLYTENVKYCTYWYYSSRERSWRSKKSFLPFAGYQIPTFDAVSQWDSVPSPAGAGQSGNTQSDELLVSVSAVDSSRPSRLVIGELVVAEQKQLSVAVEHPFFNQISQSSFCIPVQSAITYPALSSEYMVNPPAELVEYAISPQIRLVRDNSCRRAVDELSLFKQIVRTSAASYPYFEEHGLDKKAVLNRLAGLLEDPALQDYCLLADGVAVFIKSVFSDLHYYVDLPSNGPCALRKPELIKPAIRLAEIGKDVRIAADFDPSYQDLHLDDQLVSVDGFPIERLCDSAFRSLFGGGKQSSFKRYAALSSVLDRKKGDSCLIGTHRPGSSSTSLTVLHYGLPYQVPENFRPQHAAFQLIGDVAYFQIVYWEEAVYLRFINHWDELSRAKSLIIDLRGNGGGELTSATQLFSLFIDKPSLFFNYLGKAGKEEPFIINPDPHFRFPPGMKVVIIGDQSTACASEAFIRAMQSLKHAWLMAAGPTAGSIAAKYDISLPEGVMLHVNCLQKKICFKSRSFEIENMGIEPDLPVTMVSVADLKPYNNKLLDQAIKFLSADSRVMPKTD